jgi:hypothetical protein
MPHKHKVGESWGALPHNHELEETWEGIATQPHVFDDIRSTKQDDIYGTSNIVLPCPGS